MNTVSSKAHRLTYGVRETKAHLSRLLEEVKQGAEIIITDRGRPVGKLVALEPGDLSLDERLSRMTQRGYLEPITARQHLPLPPPLPMAESIAQAYLQADRER